MEYGNYKKVIKKRNKNKNKEPEEITNEEIEKIKINFEKMFEDKKKELEYKFDYDIEKINYKNK